MTTSTTMNNKSPLSLTQEFHIFCQHLSKLWQTNLLAFLGKKKLRLFIALDKYVLLLPSEMLRISERQFLLLVTKSHA